MKIIEKILARFGYRKAQPRFDISTSAEASSTQTFSVSLPQVFTLGEIPSSIALLLERSGMTKANFAKRCGVTTMTIDRTIRREIAGGYPSIKLLAAACEAAGATLDLMRFEPKDESDPRFQRA